MPAVTMSTGVTFSQGAGDNRRMEAGLSLASEFQTSKVYTNLETGVRLRSEFIIYRINGRPMIARGRKRE